MTTKNQQWHEERGLSLQVRPCVTTTQQSAQGNAHSQRVFAILLTSLYLAVSAVLMVLRLKQVVRRLFSRPKQQWAL